MIANQSRISKKFGSYPTEDPVTTTFVNTKSMKFRSSSHVFLVGINSSINNQSYMTATWVKVVNGDHYEYYSSLTQHPNHKYAQSLFCLRYDKHHSGGSYGSAMTHRVGLTSSTGGSSSTLYYWSDIVDHTSNWRLWLTSFYREPTSNKWKYDVWIDNTLMDSVYDRNNINTSSYYMRVTSSANLKAWIGLTSGNLEIRIAQQAFWYGTSGDKFTQSDADKIYNNNSPVNWSGLSLDGNKNIICHYNFGDHDNDATASLNDLSGLDHHSSSGNCDSILEDSPFV